MRSLPWQLEGNVARLQTPQLGATIDLLRPDRGLGQVHVCARPLAEARLLAIATGLFSPGVSGAAIEHYARGADLVTAYETSAAPSVRIDALWRNVPPQETQRFLAAVELVVSVRTQHFDSRPELAVESALAAMDVLPLAEPAGARGQKCLLLRLAGGELSYAEMVHPADCQHDQSRSSTTDQGLLHVNHRLFAQPLEKGVILRARVRGVFLPRADDCRLAAECYAAFAAEEPPLSA